MPLFQVTTCALKPLKFHTGNTVAYVEAFQVMANESSGKAVNLYAIESVQPTYLPMLAGTLCKK